MLIFTCDLGNEQGRKYYDLTKRYDLTVMFVCEGDKGSPAPKHQFLHKALREIREDLRPRPLFHMVQLGT